VQAINLTSEQTKVLVDTWYKDHANSVLKERFKECLKQIQDKLPITYNGHFRLRIMKTRWGSCSNAKRITLNPQLISASKECIDYVIIHELCHTLVRNHTSEFYKTLAKILPDWRERKEKLEMSMEHRLL
jgi:predicted metal-dependent hydrolase